MDALVPHIGRLAAGARNSIADVAGVTVGHCTLDEGAVQTGVTVLLPHQGDLYRHKLPAAVAVINGFGKSAGLVQLEELGTLETPIALTNTFAVGTIMTAQIRHAVQANPGIGRGQPTVNAVVMECNDGYLNDLQAFAVQESHFRQALEDAAADFAQGAVGAGRGMSTFELKGGIGSASRVAVLAEGRGSHTVGALVLSNFGKLPELILGGQPLGRELAASAILDTTPEQGSIIILIATDAPLDARQLQRLAKRAAAGLARTGSAYGHGSGDIALAFSTARTIDAASDAMPAAVLSDHLLDPLFHAVADSVEQAIVNALFAAQTVQGRGGHQRVCLRERLATLAATS